MGIELSKWRASATLDEISPDECPESRFALANLCARLNNERDQWK